jgi:hypothetical protein
MQADRRMTATNIPFPGMTNDSESACLAGVAEAVEWAHVMDNGLLKRPTQRVVIYPPTLTEFSRVLSGDTSNLAEGHEIAYQRISNACSRYEPPPAFYSADSKDFGGIDPSKVPSWMNAAAQVSVGGRRQVLEDGADVCNSESDSENEDHGEESKGVYTPDVPLDSKVRPIDARHELSSAQADTLRAQAAQPPRPSTPTPVGSTPPKSDTPPKSPRKSGKKAAPQAPAESDHPMTNRSGKSKSASRAGSSRPAAGSGQKDTCVTNGHPSKT